MHCLCYFGNVNFWYNSDRDFIQAMDIILTFAGSHVWILFQHRDTFSRPPCTLIQPSMQAVPQEPLPIPDFGEYWLWLRFCTTACIMSSYKLSLSLIYYFTLSDQNNFLLIYPFGNQFLEFPAGIPLVSLYCLQTTPSRSLPLIASKNSNHMPASYGVSSSTLTIKHNV